MAVAHALAFRRDADRRAAALEAALVRAERDRLRMQLHPHFLFNTLHAVSALMTRDVAGARRMIAGLSELLRVSLDDDDDVPLARELEILGLYLDIQRTRFADRLSITLDVDPEAHAARVPKLLLQPLVENAIRHGVEPRAGGGTVGLEARRLGDRLLLRLRDDGAGLSPRARGRRPRQHPRAAREVLPRRPPLLARVAPGRRSGRRHRPAVSPRVTSMPTHMAIRALIVDDEPLARDLLREMLAAHPRVAVVGECRSGAEAVRAIDRLAPDVVFLDVQMPEMNGFEVVAAVGAARMPRVVFVTAHDRYAVQAFEVHALDYLLKPFDDRRLARAVARLDAAGDGLDARLAALLAERAPPVLSAW
ncbi:response regulator [Nannocystis pusilla]|uniref:response regulator n=1 Tax=Nannocystis pusilla TaxID=889268 RepID=UPI003B8123FE